MKTPTLQMTGMVPLAEIITEGRLRPPSEAGVESIMASIQEVGVMKDPVHLRRKKNGTLVLIAGGHRIEAAKRLGWEQIEAKIWIDVTDDWSRMMEIDDNLAGAELTALDTAVFLAARKEVYERLHPETKAGVFKGNRHTGSLVADMMSVTSFARVTAEKFGIDERHVRRLVSAGGKLSKADVALLRAAPQPVTLKDLSDLAKIGDDPARIEVVRGFSGGDFKKIGAALKARAAREAGVKPTIKDPVEMAFGALRTLWARAPKAAKRRFLDEYAVEVRNILDPIESTVELGPDEVEF